MNESKSSPKRGRPKKSSPGRKPSPGRRASPSRRASPARKTTPPPIEKRPSRPKSPSRTKPSTSPAKTRSTTRKSPARVLKLTVEKLDFESTDRSTPPSYPRRRKPIEHETTPVQTYEDVNGGGDAQQVTSTAEMLNNSKILHLKPDYESSVIENDTKYTKSELTSQFSTKEFGGWIGALLMIPTFPVMITGLSMICNGDKCFWKNYPKIKYLTTLSTYYDQSVVLISLAYLSLLFLLSRIPYIGKKVSDPPMMRHGRRQYKMNGFVSLIVVLAIVAALETQQISILNVLRDKFIQMCVTWMIIGFSVSIGLFIHSRYVPTAELNPYGITGNGIYDFYVGRTCCPRVFGFDTKLVILRAALINVVLSNVAFVMEGIQNNVILASTKENPCTWLDVQRYWNSELSVLVTAAIMICIPMLDYFIFESRILTTFDYMYEGFGYMLVMGYMAYPFLIPTVTKYALEHGVHWTSWQISLVWLIYVLAYFVLHMSNKQKHIFRSNPYSPAVAHLETIPTSQGKKLLASGYWGVVRHPNYAADVVIHLCLYSMVPCVPVALAPLSSVFFILHRIHRDGKRCATKYGTAWERYCHRVKYNLIPKVY